MYNFLLRVRCAFAAKATYAALAKTYTYLTPDLWKETVFSKTPYQEYSDYLLKNPTRGVSHRNVVPSGDH